MTSEAIEVEANRVLDGNLGESSSTLHVRLMTAAEGGDIEGLYNLIAESPNILAHYDQMLFCQTPLHIAAEKGQTHFALELMTLKPSLALKLNASGFSPIHLALQSNHTRMVRGFITIDNSLVSIRGRGRMIPLHHVAQIGDAELLSEFLFACPSSVEDLTIKCETAVHVALKNHHIRAFKVLLGWLKRVNREEILDWKDEDGNTVLHIAALNNQTEVMKLLRKSVKVKAKNGEGTTAMDILTDQQSPCFPKASRLLRSAKEWLHFGQTMTLAAYLSRKPSLIEKQSKLLQMNHLFKARNKSFNTNDSRSATLVVAILIVTATYQAGLSPPGGYWQESYLSEDPYDNNEHEAGQMTMPFSTAVFFYAFNGIAFFLSVYVIMILIIGLPMWMVLYGSTAALGIANYASFSTTLPLASNPLEGIAEFLLPVAFPVITGLILIPPFVAFLVNKRSRQLVDFPARYFSSSQELS